MEGGALGARGINPTSLTVARRASHATHVLWNCLLQAAYKRITSVASGLLTVVREREGEVARRETNAGTVPATMAAWQR